MKRIYSWRQRKATSVGVTVGKNWFVISSNERQEIIQHLSCDARESRSRLFYFENIQWQEQCNAVVGEEMGWGNPYTCKMIKIIIKLDKIWWVREANSIPTWAESMNRLLQCRNAEKLSSGSCKVAFDANIYEEKGCAQKQNNTVDILRLWPGKQSSASWLLAEVLWEQSLNYSLAY